MNYYFVRTIYHYSTSNTPDAVYLIGGISNFGYSGAMSKFQNNQWSRMANLMQGRQGHASITFGGRTMVVGGQTSGRLV